jgi:hypothetical protein
MAASIAIAGWAFDAYAERIVDPTGDFSIDLPVEDGCVLVPRGRASGLTCEVIMQQALTTVKLPPALATNRAESAGYAMGRMVGTIVGALIVPTIIIVVVIALSKNRRKQPPAHQYPRR